MWTLDLIQESEHAAIFSPKESACEMSEFEKFLSIKSSLKEPQHLQEFDSIIAVLGKILKDCGARENLFRLEGGRIKAIPLPLYGTKKKGIGSIRLYCIRYSEKLLIIGNGGIKKMKRYEDDPMLKSMVDILRHIDIIITKESKKKHVSASEFDDFKHILETITIN